MRKRISHIIVLIGFLTFLSGLTDTINCLAQEDSLGPVIIFDCIPAIAGEDVVTGDRFSLSAFDTNPENRSDDLVFNRSTQNAIQINQIKIDSGDYTSNFLPFRYYSVQNDCYSNRVFYEIDSARADNPDSIFIVSMDIDPYYIWYDYTQICQSDESIPLNTDELLPSSIEYIADPGLFIDEERNIIPEKSIVGTYFIDFESVYCLSIDSTIVEIIETVDFSIEDTFSICLGDEFGPPAFYDEFFIINESDSTLLDAGSITQSGVYLVQPSENYCGKAGEVYIEVFEEPQFSIMTEQQCDQVLVRVEGANKEDLIYTWSNGETATEQLYSDPELNVSVSVNYGLNCITEKSVNVINQPFYIESVDYAVTEADCWEDGKLEIQNVVARNSIGAVNYRLLNTLTGEQLNDLDNVREGNYQLTVYDERGCVKTRDDVITVIQRCREEYPVFTPDNDGTEDEYFIPHEGTVKVYDRNGRFLKEISTPAYWDGTDDSGNQMPMGNYVMVTNNGRIVNITIVR